jgi:hypothetical protein
MLCVSMSCCRPGFLFADRAEVALRYALGDRGSPSGGLEHQGDEPAEEEPRHDNGASCHEQQSCTSAFGLSATPIP